jgi:alpha-galactosidase
MAKIVIIGAGSFVFARGLITDLVLYPQPGLGDSTLALMDIDKDRLDLMTAFARKIVEQNHSKIKVESSTNRKEVLEGADYVIVSIRAGDWEPVMKNQEVSMKRGVESSPDAMGTGGVFGGLRQVQAILEICRDMEKLCPDALLLNYCNPMAIICWAVNDYTKIKCVGLCPNPTNLAEYLAQYIGAPFEEITYWVAGINHFSWYLQFNWRGKDAYPLLREKFKDPEVYLKPGYFGKDVEVSITEVEMMKTFGYFTTGGGHITMYTPYFRKRPELLEKYHLHNLHDSFAIAPKRTADEGEEMRKEILSGTKFTTFRDHNYTVIAINLIYAREIGKPMRIYGNVKNTGLITNLPEGCVVEVPLLVDKEGVHPCHIGDLPPQCAALNRTNISVQEMAVRGIVEKDKNKIFQAILLDPLTSAILTIDETREMVDELFKVDKKFLKGYK